MTAMQRRFKNAVELFGDSITIGGSAKKAIVALLTRGFAYSLISVAEVDAAVRPMRLAYVPYDDSSSVGNAVTWDGLSFTVKKVVSARFQDSTIVKMLVLG